MGHRSRHYRTGPVSFPSSILPNPHPPFHPPFSHLRPHLLPLLFLIALQLHMLTIPFSELPWTSSWVTEEYEVASPVHSNSPMLMCCCLGFAVHKNTRKC